MSNAVLTVARDFLNSFWRALFLRPAVVALPVAVVSHVAAQDRATFLNSAGLPLRPFRTDTGSEI